MVTAFYSQMITKFLLLTLVCSHKFSVQLSALGIEDLYAPVTLALIDEREEKQLGGKIC